MQALSFINTAPNECPIHIIHCSPRTQYNRMNRTNSSNYNHSSLPTKHKKQGMKQNKPSKPIQIAKIKSENKTNRLLTQLKSLQINSVKWIYLISTDPKKQADLIAQSNYTMTQIMPIKPSTKYNVVDICKKILSYNTASLILIDTLSKIEQEKIIELKNTQDNTTPILFLTA